MKAERLLVKKRKNWRYEPGYRYKPTRAESAPPDCKFTV